MSPARPVLLRILLWSLVLLTVVGVLFVAVVPGPRPPPLYDHLRVLHLSMLEALHPDGSRISAHVPDGEVRSRLRRQDDLVATVHHVAFPPSRPGTARPLPGGPPAAFYFELGELAVLVDSRPGDSLVVMGNAPAHRLLGLLQAERAGG